MFKKLREKVTEKGNAIGKKIAENGLSRYSSTSSLMSFSSNAQNTQETSFSTAAGESDLCETDASQIKRHDDETVSMEELWVRCHRAQILATKYKNRSLELHQSYQQSQADLQTLRRLQITSLQILTQSHVKMLALKDEMTAQNSAIDKTNGAKEGESNGNLDLHSLQQQYEDEAKLFHEALEYLTSHCEDKQPLTVDATTQAEVEDDDEKQSSHAWQTKYGDLQRELAEKDSLYETQLSRMEAAHFSELEALRKDYTSIEENWRQQKESLEESLLLSEQQLTYLSQEKSSMVADLAASEKRCLALKSELQATRQSAEEQRKLLEQEFQEEIDLLSSQQSKSAAELCECQKQIIQLQSKIQRLKSWKENNRAICMRAEEQMSAWDMAEHNWLVERQTLQQSISEMQSLNDTLLSEQSQLLEKVVDLESELLETHRQLSSSQVELATLNKDLVASASVCEQHLLEWMSQEQQRKASMDTSVKNIAHEEALASEMQKAVWKASLAEVKGQLVEMRQFYHDELRPELANSMNGLQKLCKDFQEVVENYQTQDLQASGTVQQQLQEDLQTLQTKAEKSNKDCETLITQLQLVTDERNHWRIRCEKIQSDLEMLSWDCKNVRQAFMEMLNVTQRSHDDVAEHIQRFCVASATNTEQNEILSQQLLTAVAIQESLRSELSSRQQLGVQQKHFWRSKCGRFQEDLQDLSSELRNARQTCRTMADHVSLSCTLVKEKMAPLCEPPSLLKLCSVACNTEETGTSSVTLLQTQLAATQQLNESLAQQLEQQQQEMTDLTQASEKIRDELSANKQLLSQEKLLNKGRCRQLQRDLRVLASEWQCARQLYQKMMHEMQTSGGDVVNRMVKLSSGLRPPEMCSVGSNTEESGTSSLTLLQSQLSISQELNESITEQNQQFSKEISKLTQELASVEHLRGEEHRFWRSRCGQLQEDMQMLATDVKTTQHTWKLAESVVENFCCSLIELVEKDTVLKERSVQQFVQFLLKLLHASQSVCGRFADDTTNVSLPPLPQLDFQNVSLLEAFEDGEKVAAYVVALLEKISSHMEHQAMEHKSLSEKVAKTQVDFLSLYRSVAQTLKLESSNTQVVNRKSVKHLLSSLQQREKSHQDLQDSLTNLREQMSRLEAQALQATAEQRRLCLQVDAARDEVARCQDDLARSEEAHRVAHDEWERERERTFTKLASVENALSEARRTLSEQAVTHSTELCRVEEELHACKSELEEEHSRQVRNLLKDFQQRTSEKEAEFQRTFEDALARVREDEAHLRQQQGEAMRQTQEDLAHHVAEKSSLKCAMERAQEQLRVLMEERSNLRQELQQMTQLRDTISHELSLAQVALVNREEQLQALAAAQSSLESSPGPGCLAQSLLVDKISTSCDMAEVVPLSPTSVPLRDFEILQMHAADLEAQIAHLNEEVEQMRLQRNTQMSHNLISGSTVISPPPPPSTLSLSPSSVPSNPILTPESTVHKCHNFALSEAAEFEYLRNVTFEYLMGRERGTLSRVLCSVLKFTREQTRQVQMTHETTAATSHPLGFHLR